MIASTDPIADMLTRIRNASLVSKPEVSLPHSSINEQIAKVLGRKGFIDAVRVTTDNNRKSIVITINSSMANSRITSLKRISKPGRRIYLQAKNIKPVRRGRGIVIISTSQGIMSGDDAKTKNLGGEIICEVY